MKIKECFKLLKEGMIVKTNADLIEEGLYITGRIHKIEDNVFFIFAKQPKGKNYDGHVNYYFEARKEGMICWCVNLFRDGEADIEILDKLSEEEDKKEEDEKGLDEKTIKEIMCNIDSKVSMLFQNRVCDACKKLRSKL